MPARKPLTDTGLRNLKAKSEPFKLSDGGGLHIHVSPNGGKHFRMGFRFQGRQRLLSFGAYPAVSLATASKMRDAAKELIASGVDPCVRANSTVDSPQMTWKRPQCERLSADSQPAVKFSLPCTASMVVAVAFSDGSSLVYVDHHG